MSKKGNLIDENGNGLIAIRVHSETKLRVESLLKKANNKQIGRKVKPDELIRLALDLVTDKQIDTLKENSLTNLDRKKYLFQKYKENHGNVNWDDFEGFQMTPEWPRFLKMHSTFENLV